MNQTKKILIIDDEPDILVMLKKMMERAGFDVRLAVNGDEGLLSFYEETPDLVITDIIMPEKEGLEIIREMKKQHPALKIIAISGGGRISAESYLETAGHFGANRIFQKPFTQSEIVSAVKSLLETD
ncbi:MAG: response regulator [Bacteroidales bacterium]|nr:response regulator [Bacteroidales bacterium]MDT8432324.1 response regulator [Bacteroidales bacterium]